MGMFNEETGKISFGRVFGACCLVAVLLAWVASFVSQLFLTDTETGKRVLMRLPEMTNEIMMLGMVPYGIGKITGAWGKNGGAK